MELELQSLNLPCDDERLIVMAGPCSAETEEQVITTARQLAAKGCHLFRAGVWKPRTKPGGFEGNGEAALPWISVVRGIARYFRGGVAGLRYAGRFCR